MKAFWIVIGVIFILAGIFSIVYLHRYTPNSAQAEKIIKSVSIAGPIFGILMIVLDLIMFSA